MLTSILRLYAAAVLKARHTVDRLQGVCRSRSKADNFTTHAFASYTFYVCAAAMLKARHAAERLQGAWHGGVSSIDQLRGRMQDCLAEFVVSRDEAEVLLPQLPLENDKRQL